MRPETSCVLFIAVIFAPTHRGHLRNICWMDGWRDEQDYENCCYHYHLLRFTPLKSSTVKTLHLLMFLDGFTIFLAFFALLTLTLTFSPPQPKHIVLPVCNSERIVFQSCLHLELPKWQDYCLNPTDCSAVQDLGSEAEN